MRLRDFQKAEEFGVIHCPVRHLCPVGCVCGLGDTERFEGGDKIMPAVVEYGKGDLLWTDHRYEHHVFAIREGVVSCMAHIDPDGEAPFTLYGAGIAVGVADLYVPRVSTNTYHLHALVPGRICSLPSKALKRCLETLPGDRQQQILAASAYNQATGALIQSMISSRPLVGQRLALLLCALHSLVRRSGQEPGALRVTHDELAALTLSDRASVTRALHQLQNDGLVTLGYRAVTVSESLLAQNATWVEETCNRFTIPQS